MRIGWPVLREGRGKTKGNPGGSRIYKQGAPRGYGDIRGVCGFMFGFSRFQLALVARNSAELMGELFADKSGSNGIAQF